MIRGGTSYTKLLCIVIRQTHTCIIYTHMHEKKGAINSENGRYSSSYFHPGVEFETLKWGLQVPFIKTTTIQFQPNCNTFTHSLPFRKLAVYLYPIHLHMNIGLHIYLSWILKQMLTHIHTSDESRF